MKIHGEQAVLPQSLPLLLLLAFFVTSCSCGKYTVTEEAWFELEAKDIGGEGNDFSGRITIALFGETVPITVLNFASLARGYKKDKETLHYKNSRVHRIIPDFVVQMGDITKGDGTGGKSVFGNKFNDENFVLSHRSAGWVSMANHGRDSNGSQFFIVLSRARWLDGKHVVFGKVINGFNALRAIGEIPSDPVTALPKVNVTVVDCGLNVLSGPYNLSEDSLDNTEDIIAKI